MKNLTWKYDKDKQQWCCNEEKFRIGKSIMSYYLYFGKRWVGGFAKLYSAKEVARLLIYG